MSMTTHTNGVAHHASETDMDLDSLYAWVAPPTPAPPPLPEAACSVNCHITIAGRQIQVTLRGVSEDEVLTRLEAVLRRYPVVQPAPQGASQGPDWCVVHNTAMKRQQKGERTWYSHWTEDGTWCKGKAK